MHGRSSRHGNQKEKLRAHIVNHQHKTEGTKQKQDEALNSQSPHPVTYFLQQNMHPNSTTNQHQLLEFLIQITIFPSLAPTVLQLYHKAKCISFNFKNPYSLSVLQSLLLVFDYIWNQQKPRQQGILVREGIFLIGSFEVG